MDCLANSEWKCLCCGKDLPIEKNCISDNKELFPNIEGGTMRIDFGYPSKHDLMDSGEEFVACICDACFEEKHSLTKKIRIEKPTKYIILD